MASPSRAKTLRKPASSTLSKCVDVSKDGLFAMVPGSESLQPGDELLSYSLETLVARWGILPPLNKGESSYNEKLAETALQHCCKQLQLNVHTDHNRGVPRLSLLPSLQTSSLQRSDVNVYNQEQTKLLLQVEITSSPMRQTVNKAIRGAADLLRFLRNTAKDFNAMTVFVFPKTKHAVCVGKVTVKWEHLRFRYQINWLTGVDEAWRVIENVIMENARAMPTLPSVAELDIEVPLHLSPQDLLDFGEHVGGSATQLKCPHHVMVECKNLIYKLISETALHSALALLAQQVGDKQHTHFIVPKMNPEHKHLFFYPKVAYCPLTPEVAGQCLEELITKIEVALNELHSYGFSHNDVRLPNVCLDNDYNAVLINVDSCEDIRECPPTLSTALTGESCMYTRPTTIRAEEFTGEKMDYMQLGWLVVQVLTQSPGHHYHEMKWKTSLHASGRICLCQTLSYVESIKKKNSLVPLSLVAIPTSSQV